MADGWVEETGKVGEGGVWRGNMEGWKVQGMEEREGQREESRVEI